MLDEIAIWLFWTPLIIAFAVRCKHLLEERQYGTVSFYVSLSLHFLRIGALRLATHGGSLTYSETSTLYQILGSDYVFAAIALLNLLSFSWHLHAQGYSVSKLFTHKARAMNATERAIAYALERELELELEDDEQDASETEKQLRATLKNYLARPVGPPQQLAPQRVAHNYNQTRKRMY